MAKAMVRSLDIRCIYETLVYNDTARDCFVVVQNTIKRGSDHQRVSLPSIVSCIKALCDRLGSLYDISRPQIKLYQITTTSLLLPISLSPFSFQPRLFIVRIVSKQRIDIRVKQKITTDHSVCCSNEHSL